MGSEPRITVSHPEEQRLNGLGMMMLQYLEQNFADFDYKIEEGLKLRGNVSVEVEKGISTTLHFHGKTIQIENGVIDRPDLYLGSSYLLLSKILTGEASPLIEIIRGEIKIRAMPRRPFQSLKILRFLKIPPELLLEPRPSRIKKSIVWPVVAVLVAVILCFLIFLVSVEILFCSLLFYLASLFFCFQAAHLSSVRYLGFFPRRFFSKCFSE